MQGRLLLDIVVRKSSAIFKLLSSEDQSLLVRWNAFLVLNLCLNVIDGVRRFNFQCDGLAGKGLDEDLHSSTKTEDEMKGRFLLDVIVG